MNAAFHFPLARLLALRERRARDAAVLLAAARNFEGELFVAQASAMAQRAEARAALLPTPGTSRDIGELRNIAVLVERFDQAIAAIAAQLVIAERETARLHAVLVSCVRDRRVLERLRDRQLADWRVASSRRERTLMDAARPREALTEAEPSVAETI